MPASRPEWLLAPRPGGDSASRAKYKSHFAFAKLWRVQFRCAVPLKRDPGRWSPRTLNRAQSDI